MKIKGSKPRPRVAVVGFPLNEEDRDRIEQLFPSIYFFKDFNVLEQKISELEIDLLILGEEVENYSQILNRICVISFSCKIPYMPSPEINRLMELSAPVKTEEFIENDIPLSFSNLRERERWSNAKGWLTIFVKRSLSLIIDPEWKNANSIMSDGAIVSDFHTKRPFATIFINTKRKLGIAWIPLPVNHKIDWIEAIVNEWSKSFPDKFPSIGNWARQNYWLISDEIKIANDIKNLEDQKIAINNKIDDDIALLIKKYNEVTTQNDKTLRKLLTAQGSELVDIVQSVFEKFGFNVKKIDEQIDEGKAKKEDLRLTKDEFENWEAIVEVRGYSKSSGKEDDIKRLDKFSKLYNKENGKFPDKMIYIVNGPIELQPLLRQYPFASNPDFLASFAEDDGLVISTINLYKVMQIFDRVNTSDIVNSIIKSTGDWKFVPPT